MTLLRQQLSIVSTIYERIWDNMRDEYYQEMHFELVWLQTNAMTKIAKTRERFGQLVLRTPYLGERS